LTIRLEQVRLARAVAKASMVENERRNTGGRKSFGEHAKTVSACASQSVGHDDDRSRAFIRRRGVQPRSASIMAGGER